MTTQHKKIWLAVLPAMFLPFVASLFYFVIFKDSSVSQLAYTATKLFTLLWPIFVMRVILHQKISAWPFKLSDHLHALPMGLLSGGIVVTITMALFHTQLGLMILQSAPSIAQKAKDLNFQEHYLLFSIFLSVIHSLIEEYYWRWFVYGTLRQVLRLPTASVVAALSFAAHHFVILSQFFSPALAGFLGCGVIIGGLIWNLMYEKQKSILGSWVSHILVDMGIMAIGYIVIVG